MSFGTFYKVDDEVRLALEGKTTKSEWYDALGEIDIEKYESFDAEESAPGWAYALKGEQRPLNLLFEGELRAEPDDCNDPDVVFVSRDLVSLITKALETKSVSYLSNLLDTVHCRQDIWLLDPMLKFLKDAADNKKAVIVIWGG